MIPKIIFRRSRVYDQALARRAGFVMPEKGYFNKQIARFMRAWDKVGNKILRELSKVTKLRWYEREIICYITAGIVSFSDPLTLSLKKDVDHMLDVLTHELIHRLLSEEKNWQKIHRNWKRLMSEYKKEEQKVRTHIVIHAIHAHIFKKFFGANRFAGELQNVRDSGKSAYIRAWGIVKRDGYKEIINYLTRKMK